MPFTGVVYPEQVAMLRQVLAKHCADKRITSEADNTEAAHRIVELFMSGIDSPDELAAALRMK